MAMFEDLRHENRGMERINKSHMFLFAMRQVADRVEDFRPISLSNSIYLVIPKVLANRLRGVINDLVEPFQSAFIPGRQPEDSVVVAGKIVATLGRKGTKDFM